MIRLVPPYSVHPPTGLATVVVGPPSKPTINERVEDGLLILSPADAAPARRILFVNVSGGAATWRNYQRGLVPSHRLWGCVELVRMGYEVAIAEALPDFYFHRRPLPHDLKLLRACRSWLRRDDLVYCAHNTLFWLPLLKRLGIVRRPIVSLLYAREPLDLSGAHTGVIALTPAAEQQARRLAPKAKLARLSWGMDLDFLPHLPFRPEWFLACGRTNRDVSTLKHGAAITSAPVRVIGHQTAADECWPANVTVLPGGPGWETRLPYRTFLHECYSGSIASLITLKPDPTESTACGFTNLLEAMAMGRPAILTRTNAVPTEIDINAAGCGVFVPPADPVALARAMDCLARDPQFAQALGQAGRRLCEAHYNMQRFATDLHRFFESL